MRNMYKLFFKRFIDVFTSCIILVLFFPVLIITYILVKIDSKGPFFFLQNRLGYKAKIFCAYKIRTMTYKQRVLHIEVLKDNSEITRIGYILRRLKIDELPQFINVLKGDMSLVGPRPALPEQINDFNEDGKKRLLVKPGLTGLAQINGNIYLSWPERWVYDRIYVENLNFCLDLRIVAKTFLIILKGEERFIKKPNA